MSPDDFINSAIVSGERIGVEALSPDERFIYLITEAECICDMNGVESFLDKYAPAWLSETAAAFEAVGALDIAVELRTIAPDVEIGNSQFDHLNMLITSRAGYDNETIRRVVAERLLRRTL